MLHLLRYVLGCHLVKIHLYSYTRSLPPLVALSTLSLKHCVWSVACPSASLFHYINYFVSVHVVITIFFFPGLLQVSVWRSFIYSPSLVVLLLPEDDFYSCVHFLFPWLLQVPFYLRKVLFVFTLFANLSFTLIKGNVYLLFFSSAALSFLLI